MKHTVIEDELARYFKCLEDEGELRRGVMGEHDIKYLANKIADRLYEAYIEEQEEYRNREAELNCITQYQR